MAVKLKRTVFSNKKRNATNYYNIRIYCTFFLFTNHLLCENEIYVFKPLENYGVLDNLLSNLNL